AGPRGREHRRHGTGARTRLPQRLDHLLGVGRRRRRARHRAHRAARLPRGRGGMRRRFPPSDPLRGTVTPPPDKSISHRAALFAAMTDEPVTITNYLDAEDTRATLEALVSLGAAVDAMEGEQ